MVVFCDEVSADGIDDKVGWTALTDATGATALAVSRE